MNLIETNWSRRWSRIDKNDRIAAVTSRRDAGMNLGDIAASLSVGRTNLKAFCLRHNIEGVESEYPVGGWYDMTTEAKVAAIREKSAGNRTMSEVASDLGITTNTLHGFMWRQNVRGISNARIRINVPPDEAFVQGEPINPVVWAPIGEPVALEHNNGCSWPVDTPGGQRCCGAKKHKRSYCETHYALAYKPAPTVAQGTVDALARMDDRRSAPVAFKYVPPQSKKPVWRGEE